MVGSQSSLDRRPRIGLRRGDALRLSDSGLLFLALIVGAGAGGGPVVFRWLITSRSAAC